MGQRVYRAVIRGFVAAFTLLGLRFDVRGAEHVPRTGPAVLAINHTSYLDFALVGFALRGRGRLVRFMAKASTFDSRITGPAMRAMRHIPVDRAHGASAYRRAGRELAGGEVVGIFPEATISRSWTLKPFKLGAAALALERDVRLLPVVVWGGHRVLTVDGRWSLRRGRPILVEVGEPVPVPSGASRAEVDAQLRVRLAFLLEAVQRRYPDEPGMGRDRWWLPTHLGGSAPTPERAALLDAEALARGAHRDRRPLERRRVERCRTRRLPTAQNVSHDHRMSRVLTSWWRSPSRRP